MKAFSCRFCRAPLRTRVVDLGMSPLCESYVEAERLDAMEPFYPLHVWVCERCLLVQLNEYVRADEIFTEYAYFSSFSTAWLEHAASYVSMITTRLQLGPSSHVVELASNDGYLLQYFVAKQIPCLGVEPAANVAAVAREKGVPTDVSFFGVETARRLLAEGKGADLIIGNNVLAQVPDLNDFVGGVRILLKPNGTGTFEFPHLMRLFEENQFDTIYHEHFSYFSLLAIETIFSAHGLTVFDVEELWTHGGSLRIYVRPSEDNSRPVTEAVLKLRSREESAGYRDMATYTRFEEQVRQTKRHLLGLLIQAKNEGKRIVGYGAPGKGNTLLNYCGIRGDFLDYTVDRNPYKQGKFLPGTHIPIFEPGRIDVDKPELILILPWNFKDEIMQQLEHARGWGSPLHHPYPQGGNFVTLPLTIQRDFGQPLSVLCLGAHSDDIEIGCGGTLLRLLSERAAVNVDWVVFSATPEREAEARASASVFLERAAIRRITIKDFRESFFPYLGAPIKNFFEELKAQLRPDMIFTHRQQDAHQDHRLIGELTWNTFRDHLILEYEIPKCEGDLGHPNVFVPLLRRVADTKVRLLLQHFRSQASRRWFKPDTFDGLMSLRGVECNAPEGRAEAFSTRGSSSCGVSEERS